jgi:hypothetical protein
MLKLIRNAALCFATAAAMAGPLASSAEAGCRYYGPGSTGCAHKAPPMVQTLRPQVPVFQPRQPAQNYSYGRVWINPNTFRSGGGIIRNGAYRQGAAWVSPRCQRIPVGLICR